MPVLLASLAPVFALIALGWLLRRLGVLGAVGTAELGRLLFYVALPVRLALETSARDLRQGFEPAAIGAALASFAAGLTLAWAASRRLAPGERGAVINGAARANGAFVGLPVIALLAAALAPVEGESWRQAYAVVLGCMVPAFNVGSVLAFRLPHAGDGGLREALLAVPRNPIIIGCVAGSLLGLWRPGCLQGGLHGEALALVGACAIPLALIATGSDLDLGLLRRSPRLLAACCAAKLLLLPAIAFALCRWWGVGPAGTGAAVVLSACPTAVASVPMARLLGGDERLMAALVAATTVLSPLTLFAWLCLLR